MSMSSKTLGIALATICGLGCALGATACDKGGEGGRKASDRLKWVQSPKGGSEAEGVVTIPGLALTFEKPETLYVYKDCGEASHSPDSAESSWIPVISCSQEAGDAGDELEEDSEILELTFYVTKNDAVINERSVTSWETDLKAKGYQIESVAYYDEYMNKSGRRGIEVMYHTLDKESGYPDREVKRFFFPKGDVLFILQVEFPYGNDRSGINADWQRIYWNFQFDEDGPLYPDTGEE